ncbi:Ubiquitin system component Cue [Nosema bombycis CQ1]|uniref:Ubiquitin system component Cue n=1 Tax=Nosema bombycis (strain CQ1 / CVCC 102059) TaxID=578461 RepID=R0KPA6_NOSB1|nr:Ubiquitin system component Cue [Nosema bombycis CQ1]|eukprot:EOB12531.1 Ubiquitin system component Cue [Nosema bombycis CQ1]
MNFIKEMFPDLDDVIIKRLLDSTNNNVDLVVTKILDGTYKGIHFNIKDINSIKIKKPICKQPIFKKDLYFPELIEDFSSIQEEIDIEKNRKEIKRLNNKILEFKSNSNYKLRQASEYYSEVISEIKRDIDKLNRECTLSILKKTLKEPGALDLHVLYTKDALRFIDDYLRIYEPKVLKLITGSEESSLSLRPSLIKFFKEKKYTVQDEGPCLVVRKE